MALADPVLTALREITIGDYDINGRLGVGGMASVYLAHELRLNRRVAIKALLPALLESEDMLHRFFDEARKQARLEHPNIVPIYALHWNEDVPFFTMKFVDGFSLDDVTDARGALPIPVVQHVLNGMIAGLQYAHDEGVIHRDVKPGNVLIDRRGQLVVSDFGIAKAAESPHLTQTGSAVGTPAYMSPEQFDGRSLTPASDQYAVGVVAFQMIVGSPPFAGSSMLELLQAQLNNPTPSIIERRPDCPPRLAAAVMRMLEKSPDDRWPELRDALPDVVNGMGSEADARRQLVALFPKKKTAAESLPTTPRSPMPTSGRPPKHSVPPVSLVVGPSSGASELRVGESVEMTVRRSDTPDNTDAGQSTAGVVWQTSDEKVVNITADGRATARRTGFVTIIATDGSLTGRCVMSIVAANEQPIEPKGPISIAADTNRAVESDAVDGDWFVPSTTPASLPSSKKRAPWRLATMVGAGLAASVAIAVYTTRNRAPATSASPVAVKSDTATAAADTSAVVAPAGAPAAVPAPTAIAPRTVARLSIQLTRAQLREGDSTRVTARAFDSTGNRMTTAKIALVSSEPNIVRVQSDGLIIALSTGTATVTARSGTIEKSETITVDARLLPLSAADVSAALAPVLASISAERWDDVQTILTADVLDAMRGKRGIKASLSGDPHITNSTIDSATVDFDIALQWRTIARLGRSGTAPLRATFARAGQSWHMTEIAARGKLP
ncbi:MAG TPA: protein kinase [Gemmatimonadaceae bacterium]|nr:protein kinase [Gemmatimonadaceae bacterium]